MAASRFRSLNEENIVQLLNDKDSENTKKSTKQHRFIFESYLEEKNILRLQSSWRQFYESLAPRREERMDTCKIVKIKAHFLL